MAFECSSGVGHLDFGRLLPTVCLRLLLILPYFCFEHTFYISTISKKKTRSAPCLCWSCRVYMRYETCSQDALQEECCHLCSRVTRNPQLFSSCSPRHVPQNEYCRNSPKVRQAFSYQVIGNIIQRKMEKVPGLPSSCRAAVSIVLLSAGQS